MLTDSELIEQTFGGKRKTRASGECLRLRLGFTHLFAHCCAPVVSDYMGERSAKAMADHA